jgi:hypothetical protein
MPAVFEMQLAASQDQAGRQFDVEKTVQAVFFKPLEI